MPRMEAYRIISGFAVGLLVGVTGVGGGSLMTPLLTLGFGYSPTVAVGTDLAFAAVTKSVGTLVHGRYGQVHWRAVASLCAGSLPAALVTLLFIRHVGPASHGLMHAIRIIIGVSVLLTVLALALRTPILNRLSRCGAYPLRGRTQILATIVAGAVLGVLITLSSIGAGAIGATLIFLLYPTLAPAEVAGTDIAYAVPLTVVAAAGHWWLGHLDWPLLGALLLGSVPGIWLGARVARALPQRYVRATLATALTLLAVRLIV